MNNKDQAAALRHAATAIEQLDAHGIQVLGSYSNGRRPVLLLERKPAFVTGAMQRRQPTGRGVDRVYAANYFGCQIEWNEHTPSALVVGHG